MTYTCSVCGGTKTESIPANGHDYGEWTTTEEPTCTEGSKERICSVCNDKETSAVDALGHSWDEGEITAEPTCTEEGEKTFVCTVCQEDKVEAVPANGHAYGEWDTTKEPTCTETGSKERVCSVCEYKDVEEIDALGHDFGDWTETKAPTCTDKGIETRTCKHDATHTETRDVDALGHDMHDVADTSIEATCTESGKEADRKCSRCDHEETGAVIPEKGHTEGAATRANEVAATCEAEGTYDEVVNCTVCDEELSHVTTTIDAHGHTWDTGKVTTEATITAEGVKTFTCNVCGDTKTVSVPALKSANIPSGKTLTYSGEAQRGVDSGEGYTLTGTLTATQSGTYNAKAALNAGYAWSDGTTDAKPISWVINKATISNASVSGISDKTYTGNALTQSPTVKFGGKTLKNGTDYTCTYKNNVNAGTATITFTGKGAYEGSLSKTFKINAKAVTPSVTLSASAYTYNGGVKKPGVTVKIGSTKLAASGYTVTYAAGRKNVGKYNVTVKLKGNYSGSKTVSFKINPKGSSVSKLAAVKKGFNVTWARQKTKMSTSVITGYQIQYSTNKKFSSGNKTITVKGYNSATKAIRKLASKKTYYVRIRTYKTVSKVNYYSGWSAAKAVKTK